MAALIPGQNTDSAAQDFMPWTPWCAECKYSRTSCRNDRGMSTRLLNNISPSHTDKSSLCRKYSFTSSGHESLETTAGNPICMTCINICKVGSLAVSCSTHSTDTAWICLTAAITTSLAGSRLSVSSSSTNTDRKVHLVLSEGHRLGVRKCCLGHHAFF